MAFKLVIFLLCACALQGLNGQVPLTCSQKVNIQLRPDISLSARTASLDVSTAASAISNNIIQARANIKIALIDLQKKASAATGPNIGVCRTRLAADLVALNDNNFSLCYKSLEINILNQRVNQINALKGPANLICRNCLNDAACEDAQIDSISQQAQDFQLQISSDAADLQEESAECTQAVANGQLEIIRNASENFDACIGA